MQIINDGIFKVVLLGSMGNAKTVSCSTLILFWMVFTNCLAMWLCQCLNEGEPYWNQGLWDLNTVSFCHYSASDSDSLHISLCWERINTESASQYQSSQGLLKSLASHFPNPSDSKGKDLQSHKNGFLSINKVLASLEAIFISFINK